MTEMPAGPPAAVPWRERMRAMRRLPEFFRLVWRTHRGFTVGIAATRAVRALLPLAMLWVGKLIVDEVVAQGGAAEPAWGRLAALVAVELALTAVGEVASRVSQLWEGLFGELFANRVSERLMAHAASLDLHSFEDAAFHDQLDRARREALGRLRLIVHVLTLAQDAVTLLTLAGALLAFSPALFLLLGVMVVPSFLGETHFATLGYSLWYHWTPRRRMVDYLRLVGTSSTAVKEVKLFGLSGYLIDRHRELSDALFRENRSLAVRRARLGTVLALLSTLGYYAAYAFILARTVRGALSLGDLVLLAGSFQRSRDVIQRLLSGTADLYKETLHLEDLFSFLATRPSIVRPARAASLPRPLEQGFELRDVWFRYPAAERAPETPWVLRGVSFRIGAGDREALVGENGAGKTTLVKLLLRLYEPTRGEILLEGLPLAAYDPAELHRQVGVIFQDFVRYDLTVRENVAVGCIDVLDEAPGDADARIASAVLRAQARETVEALPLRYETMLGKRFDGGAELSGGQWQKLALARAYMRDAQVLILDEPTAALDARAEYEVYQRFTELTDGKIAVLVSHRFSTVRMATRILVLEEGRVREEGSHAELLALGGRYAELFNLQAAGYR